MKKNLLTILMTLLVISVFAKSDFGKDYFAIGEYSKAKAIFEAKLASSPAEANYYLGEIAWKEGKNDEALSYYEKGLKANPAYMLNLIGKGKVLLKTKPAEAEVLFATALKKAYKKDPDANAAVVRAYMENGMKDKMTAQLIKANKVAKKSVAMYILEGDILAADEKTGPAGQMYEQAIYLDTMNVVARIKAAQLYESSQTTQSSYSRAVEILESLLKTYPDFDIINRNIGRAYNSVGKYKPAIEAFVKYYGEGNCNLEDISRLASAYYFTDQYAQAKVLLDKGMAQTPSDFVLNRLKMYVAAKTKDSTGVIIAEQFFKLNGTFIDRDYATYATILADAGKNAEALVQYDKVLSANAAKAETYGELAALYYKMLDYAKSGETYQKYIDMLNASTSAFAEAPEYYSMGRAWYYAGRALRADSTDAGKAKAKEYLILADTAFGTVAVKAPDSHIGNIWRGHANSEMDRDATLGLAKPYYEKALALMLKNIEGGKSIDNYKKDMLNIYQYEAFYYYMKDDKTNALMYSNKMLELDPNNKDAKNLITAISQPEPTAAPAKTTTKGAASTKQTAGTTSKNGTTTAQAKK